ncbi:hypothetical protein [Bdellovibrio sp. HCB2-146]|uniref:hypothetical protein n=1 Tax=Bdellovibrio sp. HCB2-146 TaxID=3394362 RepID=UPI0039BC2A15
MSTTAWYEHFKEKLDGLQEDFASSHAKVSLLVYAFQIERISSEEYLSWAMAHYQLPKLQSRFFLETPPSQEMFAKWATHYLWSAECLPVAEWDGSLIVACLQPPQDFPSSLNVIPVLASVEDLAKAWESYHKEEELAIPTAETQSVPEGIDLSMATVVHPNKSDAFSIEDLGIDSSDDSSPSVDGEESEDAVAEIAPEEALEGLSFDAPTTLVKLESLAPLAGEQTSTGLIKTEPVAKAEVSDATAIFKPTTPDTEPLTLSSIPTPAPVSTPTPAPAVAKAAPVIPPPPQKKAEETKVDDKTNTGIRTRDVAGTAAAAAVAVLPVNPQAKAAKPSSNPGMDASFCLESLKKKNASLDEKVKTTFTEMKSHFEKSLILTLDEKESQLLVYAWDESFKGVRDPSIRVPLRLPSIFNIVASTQKPFHGYISLNEINEKFFEDWNQGRIPDHVTITPLILGEKMVGMLMGFAEKSAYNKMSLGLAERLATDFVKNLKAA